MAIHPDTNETPASLSQLAWAMVGLAVVVGWLTLVSALGGFWLATKTIERRTPASASPAPALHIEEPSHVATD